MLLKQTVENDYLLIAFVQRHFFLQIMLLFAKNDNIGIFCAHTIFANIVRFPEQG